MMGLERGNELVKSVPVRVHAPESTSQYIREVDVLHVSPLRAHLQILTCNETSQFSDGPTQTMTMPESCGSSTVNMSQFLH